MSLIGIDHDALRREVREELGLQAIELGDCVWTRRHIGTFRGRPFDQSERIYLARTWHFAPRPSPGHEREHTETDMRWWSVAELEQSPEEFAPRRLPVLIRSLLADGPPAAPVDVGI